MGKRSLTPALTFTPGSNTLNLSGIASFDLRNLYAVINLTTGAIVYAPLPGYTATAAGTVLTLSASLSGMAATDSLMVIYEDQPIPDAVSGWATATGAWQSAVQAALGKVTDTGAAPDDEGGYTIGALIKRGLKNWTTFFLRMPASLGQKLAAASFPVVLASDQAPLPILPFAGLKRQTLEVSATTTATANSGIAVPASWAGATAFRVRNPAGSASPVTFALTDSASMPPVIPTAYAQDGTGGGLGDKTLDPGAVEVFQLSANQSALLAAGTLKVSVITKVGTGSLLFTPGTGV